MQYKAGVIEQMYRKQQAEYEARKAQKALEEQQSLPVSNMGNPTAGQLVQLPVDSLEDFPAEIHPFHPATAVRLEELRQDIITNGILAPLLVRQIAPGRYQILAGHNRRRAAKLAKYDNVPCIVKNVTDDEAINIMLSDNLYQREDLLPSEKAYAYKLKLETMRRKAGRPKAENNVPSGHNSLVGKSREILAAESPDSNTQIQRYIRLTQLSKDLLNKVDSQAIGLQIGATLSYLSPEAQETVYTYYFVDNTSQHIDQSLANELRTIDSDPDQLITPEVLDRLATERAERRFRQVKVQMKDIRKYFRPEVTKEDVVETIEKALAFYYENRQLGGKGHD